MPTPKLYSRAMITIILISVLHVTLIALFFSFIFSQFFVDESMQELFLYYINFIIPVTFITAVLKGGKMGKTMIFMPKGVTATADEEENLITWISIKACLFVVLAIIGYEIIYYLVFHIGQILSNLNIMMLPVIVFGVFFTGLIVVYIFTPIFVVLNVVLSYFTNRIFNAFFAGFYEKMPPTIDENE